MTLRKRELEARRLKAANMKIDKRIKNKTNHFQMLEKQIVEGSYR